MPKSILAAIDLAASTEQIAETAKEYSKAFSAKLYLVHVAFAPEVKVSYPQSSTGPGIDVSPLAISVDREAEADRLRGEHRALQELGRELSEVGIDVTALSVEGETVDKLVLEITRLEIDLVIIGSHAPRFLQDFLFGSTTKEVLREAGCPVLILPPPSR